jgi:hypothetical protein
MVVVVVVVLGIVRIGLNVIGMFFAKADGAGCLSFSVRTLDYS